MELKETKRAGNASATCSLARHPAVLAATAALLCLAAQTASATLIRVDFQSRVTGSQSLPILGIVPSIGDTVTGHFIYDTEALDQDPGDPTHGQYSSGSIQIEIGGLMLSSAATAQQVTWDVDGPNDIWFTDAGWNYDDDNDDGLLVNGVFTPRVRLGMFFSQPTGALTSDAQPTLAELGLLEVTQFHLLQDDPDSVFHRIVFFNDVTVCLSPVAA